MAFDQIENKKREYTDKYVMVDASQPELARFKGVVGQVKTVNMSGRALVEFMDYHLNVGWYDIDPDFLKVVDKPAPKVEKPAAKKPAAKPEAKAPAAAKPPAAAAAKAGKASVADILAAARGDKATGPAGEIAAATGTPSARPPAPEKAPAAAADRAKMSVADMLAAARTGGAAGAKPQTAAPAAKAPLPQKPTVAEPKDATDEPVGEVAAATGKTAAAGPKSTEKIDRSKMSVDDMLAWCRQHDAT